LVCKSLTDENIGGGADIIIDNRQYKANNTDPQLKKSCRGTLKQIGD
jgi:hypothetical protein